MTADDAGSAQEADATSGSASAGPAPRRLLIPHRKLITRGRHHAKTRRPAWRAWRRSRPFWGGLLLVLAGLELFGIPLSGVLGRGAIKLVIYIGIGGVFGVLIGLLLLAAGVMLWINPANRVFYGIAGIVLGIVSFPASNLGGFFLGMLLAIIGGSLGFAWAPVDSPPVPDGTSDVGDAGDADDASDATGPEVAGMPEPTAGPAALS
jgi:Family of unknown function (DUF6114)